MSFDFASFVQRNLPPVLPPVVLTADIGANITALAEREEACRQRQLNAIKKLWEERKAFQATITPETRERIRNHSIPTLWGLSQLQDHSSP